ncbi:MAG: hypothetical protein K6E49_09065 [Lachnospiraceae bacterium]|nr:hypothetical protein [Lachnospiraceae bacterium]
MRKVHAILYICLISAALLAGCSAASEGDLKDKLEKVKEETAHEEITDESNKEEPEKKPVKKNKNKKKEKKDKEAYQEILYKYKEAQDKQYSMDDVESMGLHTELVQHGWPSGGATDDVKYLYYDVDSDGNDELIIKYYGEIIDIYGYDGQKAKLAFSTPYRGIAELHPDGMLQLLYSVSVTNGSTSWYRYDSAFADYFEVFECRSDNGNDSYYTFGAYNMDDEERRQVEGSYRDIGTYPVWLYEWSDELTEDEYENIVPTTEPIKLPAGDPLSDIILPDDYEYAQITDNAAGQESADTIVITEDMQKKLNVFLSNFAEQSMPYFDYGRPDTGDLADFAYRWTYINKWTDLDITTDGYYTLSLDKVKNVVNKYMDIDLTDDDLNSYTWPNVYQGFVSNGKYCVPAADGESYEKLAVVTSLSEEGADNYRAQFDIYDLNQDYFSDNEDADLGPEEFYSYNAAEAASEPKLIKNGSGYAVIKKDGDSYRLRYYDRNR